MWLDKYTIRAEMLRFAFHRMDGDERARAVMRDLTAEAQKFWLVLDGQGTIIGEAFWSDTDDYNGAPNWAYEYNYQLFLVNLNNDTVEWVPAIGPAPVWTVKFSKYKDGTEDALWTDWRAWYKKTY